MKAAIFSLSALCIAPAFGAAAATPTDDAATATATPTEKPLLPNIATIFTNKCGVDFAFTCSKAAEALEPYAEGDKEFDLAAILKIGMKIKEEPDCVKLLPVCAGKVAQAALSEILDVPDVGCNAK